MRQLTLFKKVCYIKLSDDATFCETIFIITRCVEKMKLLYFRIDKITRIKMIVRKLYKVTWKVKPSRAHIWDRMA